MKIATLIVWAVVSMLARDANAADFARQNYILRCSGCHRSDGTGAPTSGVPNINGVLGHFTRVAEGRAFLVQVPGTSNSPLNDAEVAELLNWMLKRFSPEEIPTNFVPYTASEVTHLRAEKLDDVSKARTEIVRKLAEMGFKAE